MQSVSPVRGSGKHTRSPDTVCEAQGDKVQQSSARTGSAFIDWQHPRASPCLQISSGLETGFNYQTVSPHQNAKQEHRVSG